MFKSSVATLLETIRFLLTPFQSLPRIQENPTASLDKSITVLVCIFFSILNSIMEEWKYGSRELLKTSSKSSKKEEISAWNFLEPPIQVCRGAYIPDFKISPTYFLLSSINVYVSFLRSGSTKQMVKEHTVNYHHSPSELTSRIHSLIFLWTPKGLTYPEYFFNFSSKLYILPWFRKSFKFLVLRLLENTFVS